MKEIPGIRAFPDPRDVFVPEQVGLATYIDPLVSIDLALVNPSWHGVVHMVSPVEPMEDLVGDDAQEYWTDLVRPNWMTFAVEDDRYRFLADERYFLLASLEATPAEARTPKQARKLQELRGFYARQRASFEATKAYFAAHGSLVPHDPDGQPHWDTASAILDQVGGQPGWGNWVDTEPFPVETGVDAGGEELVWPLTPRGNKFQFVAGVPGYHYRNGADWVLLFYQPEERLALVTFDWS